MASILAIALPAESPETLFEQLPNVIWDVGLDTDSNALVGKCTHTHLVSNILTLTSHSSSERAGAHSRHLRRPDVSNHGSGPGLGRLGKLLRTAI